MTASSPRRLADVPGLEHRGLLPPEVLAVLGGDECWLLGSVMYILPAASRFPPPLRPAVEAFNVAVVTGTCPLCGAWRPAMLATPAGVGPLQHHHEPGCAAAPEEIARALDTDHDHPNERE